ncbi:MAG: Gfo/Idh/MocA family oxidoreductase [Albidovulum sp.]|nr:Gfo/Idh/MocA family oxidoreductase [Albidovulum sp.]
MAFRVAGISFDHMHMGDLLRMAHDHPEAEIAGIFDPNPDRMSRAIADFGIPESKVFTELEACIETARPDLAILCVKTAEHAAYTERLAALGVNVMVEKPFAATADEARRMIAAMEKSGKTLAINWPLAWVESHATAKRWVDEGKIGKLIEVHSYGGNRGPLYHLADKIEVSREEVERQKPTSWWYKREAGGGSLLDYLGYGATLGTWYMNGEAPLDVTSAWDAGGEVEVDQHSITICRYSAGLSKMETRWGTFTDPWTIQPQPKCGFVLVGEDGTISSYDYDEFITVQNRAQPNPTRVPVDRLPEGRRNGVEYVLSCISEEKKPEGCLDPALCLTAQRIVDTAFQAAESKRTMELLP